MPITKAGGAVFRQLYIVVLFLFTLSAYAADVYKDITLTHRPASEVQQMLSPLLPKTCAVSGEGNQLLVKCDPQQVTQIVNLVTELDVPQKTLVIRFKQIVNADFNLQNGRVGAVKSYSTQPQANQMQEREIMVQNGQEAYVNLGSAFPYQQFFVSLFGFGSEQKYQQVMSGFSVLPSLSGSQVSMDINWKYEKIAQSDSYWQQRHSEIEQSQASTKITLPLGEWVDISQYGTKSYVPQHTKVYSTQEITQPQTHLLIRADLSPQVHSSTTYDQ